MPEQMHHFAPVKMMKEEATGHHVGFWQLLRKRVGAKGSQRQALLAGVL